MKSLKTLKKPYGFIKARDFVFCTYQGNRSRVKLKKQRRFNRRVLETAYHYYHLCLGTNQVWKGIKIETTISIEFFLCKLKSQNVGKKINKNVHP